MEDNKKLIFAVRENKLGMGEVIFCWQPGNRMLAFCGENRVITSDISGTTRDSIEVNVKVNGQDYILVDTAGLRKKAKVKDDTIEEYGTIRSIEALSNKFLTEILTESKRSFKFSSFSSNCSQSYFLKSF